MYKLSFSKPSYKVYKDNKITLCTYRCTVHNTKTKEVFGTFTVTGKSVCSDTDTPDAKTGRAIAESRAKYRAYATAKELTATTNDMEELFEKLADMINVAGFYHYLTYLKKKELEHIKFLKEGL